MTQNRKTYYAEAKRTTRQRWAIEHTTMEFPGHPSVHGTFRYRLQTRIVRERHLTLTSTGPVTTTHDLDTGLTHTYMNGYARTRWVKTRRVIGVIGTFTEDK